MNGGELSDEQLMARVASGDNEALELLYDRYAASVMGLAARILQDRAAAEERVMEAFWQVWRQASAFQAQSSSVSSWLFSIAHHLFIQDKERPHLAPDEVARQPMNTNADTKAGETKVDWMAIKRQQVRAAIAELPPEQFRVIELAYFQGLTREEIAQLTGESLDAIHTQARQMLQKLHEIVKAESINRPQSHS
jgi:RNA polymerase sigma-70 factor (ECF subfamily)